MAYCTTNEPLGLLGSPLPVLHLPFEVGDLLAEVTVLLE
jgi:hypothetical protein